MELSNITKDTPMQIKANLDTQDQSCRAEQRKNDYFTLKVYKSHTLEICTPLLTLKILYLIWSSVSTIIVVFFTMYLKQKGIRLQEIFLAVTLAPIVQIISMSIISVLIDKFGHAKFFFVLGLFTSGTLMLCILHAPSLKDISCENDQLSFKCENKNWTELGEKLSLFKNTKQQIYCRSSCLKEMDYDCDERNSTCLNMDNENNVTLSLIRPMNCSKNSTNCFYFIDDSSRIPILCDSNRYNACNLTCVASMENCDAYNRQRNQLGVVYVFLIVVLLSTYTNTFRFIDISAHVLVKRHSADYGLVRLCSNIGNICGPILAGSVVHLTSSAENTNYSSVLYYYSVICLLSACISLRTDICGVDRGREMWKKSLILIKSPDILVFYILLIILGCSWGFSVTYRVWFLAGLDAEPYVFSLLDVVRNVCALFVLYKSKWILDKLGERNLIFLALLGYVMYMFSYSFLQTAWPSILIEVFRITCYNLLWVPVINYCIKIAPKGLTATVTASAGLIHYSFGRVGAGCFGGVLVANFGGRTAFQIMGFINLAFAMAYVVYLLYRHKKGFVSSVAEQRDPDLDHRDDNDWQVGRIA